ncbi:MAG: Glycosyltransferase [Parcubacteria group bacterium GW2011_GWD2_42_14]|nr:MAG: Glycosyltransferase [Parcubacteria group bacterium GW2011_GWD2_42_14]
MRILLLNYEYPPLGGGAGNSTMNIAKSYAKLGHQVLVLTTWHENLLELEKNNNLTIVRIKSRRKRKDRSNPFEMLSYSFLAIKNRKLVLDFMPDYSIAFMALPSGIPAYFFFKKFKIPYILSVQGGDVPGFLSNIISLRIYHFISLPLTKILWRNSIKVIANSKGLMQLAQKTGTKINTKIGYFPNGVDLDFFKPKIKRIENKKPTIIFVGRFSPQKGLEYLLEATFLLKKKYGDCFFKLELVGDGPEKKKIVNLIDEYDLKKIVTISPWCSKEELLEKYQNSDIFVLSSHEEGMPNVLSEAMACRLSIVSTRVRGSDELIENNVNGFLVEPRNAEELADKIDILISNKEIRERFSTEGLKKISNFSWENVAEYYLNVYEKYKKHL